jgi:anti-sigma28 factor (negative regulator of flagellin synthesis)
MKIDNQNLNGAAGLQPARTVEAPAVDALTSTSRTQGTATDSGDRAEISNLAGHISQALATQTVGRAQRIQELAQQYSAGTYKPDAQSVSRALIEGAIGGKGGA